MPFYIAGGKTARAECSIKIFAHSDEEAFDLAKGQLPIVTGMERIEPDGSLVSVTHLPFDSVAAEVVSADERRVQHGQRVEGNRKLIRKILMGVLLLLLLGGCCVCPMSILSVINRANAPVPQQH